MDKHPPFEPIGDIDHAYHVARLPDRTDTWERAGKRAMVALRPGDLPAVSAAERYLTSAAAMAKLVPPGILLPWLHSAQQRWPANALVRFARGNAQRPPMTSSRLAAIAPGDLLHFLRPWRSAAIAPGDLLHFLRPWRSKPLLRNR